MSKARTVLSWSNMPVRRLGFGHEGILTLAKSPPPVTVSVSQGPYGKWPQGSSHYIVWSTRSSDAVTLCPTRKKIDISLFMYFSLRHAQNSNVVFFSIEFVYFYYKKSLSNFFFIFYPDRSQNVNSYF